MASLRWLPCPFNSLAAENELPFKVALLVENRLAFKIRLVTVFAVQERLEGRITYVKTLLYRKTVMETIFPEPGGALQLMRQPINPCSPSTKLRQLIGFVAENCMFLIRSPAQLAYTVRGSRTQTVLSTCCLRAETVEGATLTLGSIWTPA